MALILAFRPTETAPPGDHQQLEISGFTKAGIHINGARTYSDERERIVVEDVVFRNGAPTAVGMQPKVLLQAFVRARPRPVG